MGDRTRVQEKLVATARSGADLVTLWRAATPLLAQAVPHAASPCFFTVDPDSLLVTSHFQEGLPEVPAAWLGREYAEPDANAMTDVLRSPRGVGTLHEATGGHPALSRKYHEEMRPFGCEQELLLALRTRDGERWGVVGLYREDGRPLFDAADERFLRSVAPALAEGVRHALLLGQAVDPDLDGPPGLVLVDEDLAVESVTPEAARLLEDLGGSAASLPASVLAVAGRSLADPAGVAVARAPGTRGWLSLHASTLLDDGGRRVSVILQAAQPGHLAPLLLRAYGLTAREREVTVLALRGASTAATARSLRISENTVQQHLTHVFDKTGVRSRRALTALVFQGCFEPRVRDNERRTTAGRPSRGGPKDRRDARGAAGPGA